MAVFATATGVLLLLALVWGSGLYRVVRGDPLEVDQEIDEGIPAVRLRLRMVGRAGPLVVTGVRLEGKAAELADSRGPTGMNAIEPAKGTAWMGRLPVGDEPVTLTIPLRRLGPASGRLVIDYTYASVLARMPSSAWVPIEIPPGA